MFDKKKSWYDCICVSTAKKEIRPKSVNEERENMEEMKLLEPAEPMGDSSGLGLSDKDVVDLEEGTSPKKGEPEKQEEEEPEEKMVVVEETGKEQAGEKKGNEYVDVDLKTPDADQSQQPASLDSDWLTFDLGSINLLCKSHLEAIY